MRVSSSSGVIDGFSPVVECLPYIVTLPPIETSGFGVLT